MKTSKVRFPHPKISKEGLRDLVLLIIALVILVAWAAWRNDITPTILTTFLSVNPP